MAKRIFLSSFIALAVIGCKGGDDNVGTANVYGVNADPNQGAITILANGSTVLNSGAFGATSGTFTTVSSGSNAAVIVSKSDGTSLAQTNFLSGFLNSTYYAIYAYGGASSQSADIMPLDVSQPPATLCRLMFTNTSVIQPSVDVYVTTQASPSGLLPTRSGVSAFNSGFTSEVNNIAPGTYNVFFTQAGNQTIVATSAVTLGTTPAGAGANEIALVGIADAPGATIPILQQAIPSILLSAVTGATAPMTGIKPTIIKGQKQVS